MNTAFEFSPDLILFESRHVANENEQKLFKCMKGAFEKCQLQVKYGISENGQTFYR